MRASLLHFLFMKNAKITSIEQNADFHHSIPIRDGLSCLTGTSYFHNVIISINNLNSICKRPLIFGLILFNLIGSLLCLLSGCRLQLGIFVSYLLFGIFPEKKISFSSQLILKKRCNCTNYS